MDRGLRQKFMIVVISKRERKFADQSWELLRGTLNFEERSRRYGKPCPKSRQKYPHSITNSGDIADGTSLISENTTTHDSGNESAFTSASSVTYNENVLMNHSTQTPLTEFSVIESDDDSTKNCLSKNNVTDNVSQQNDINKQSENFKAATVTGQSEFDGLENLEILGPEVVTTSVSPEPEVFYPWLDEDEDFHLHLSESEEEVDQIRTTDICDTQQIDRHFASTEVYTRPRSKVSKDSVIVVSHEEPESVITDLYTRVADDSSTAINEQTPERGMRNRLVLNETAKKKYNFRAQLALPRKYVLDQDSDSSSTEISGPVSGLELRSESRPSSSFEKTQIPKLNKNRTGSSLELFRNKLRSGTNPENKSILAKRNGTIQGSRLEDTGLLHKKCATNKLSGLEIETNCSPQNSTQLRPVKRSLADESSSSKDRSETKPDSAHLLVKRQRRSRSFSRPEARVKQQPRPESSEKPFLQSRSKSLQRPNLSSRSNSIGSSNARLRSKSLQRSNSRSRSHSNENSNARLRSKSLQRSNSHSRSNSNESSNARLGSKSTERLRVRSRSSARIRDGHKTSYEESYPSDIDEGINPCDEPSIDANSQAKVADSEVTAIVSDTGQYVKPLLETIQKLASKRAKLIKNCSHFTSGAIQTSNHVVDENTNDDRYPEPKRRKLDKRAQHHSNHSEVVSSKPSITPKQTRKPKTQAELPNGLESPTEVKKRGRGRPKKIQPTETVKPVRTVKLVSPLKFTKFIGTTSNFFIRTLKFGEFEIEKEKSGKSPTKRSPNSSKNVKSSTNVRCSKKAFSLKPKKFPRLFVDILRCSLCNLICLNLDELAEHFEQCSLPQVSTEQNFHENTGCSSFRCSTDQRDFLFPRDKILHSTKAFSSSGHNSSKDIPKNNFRTSIKLQMETHSMHPIENMVSMESSDRQEQASTMDISTRTDLIRSKNTVETTVPCITEVLATPEEENIVTCSQMLSKFWSNNSEKCADSLTQNTPKSHICNLEDSNIPVIDLTFSPEKAFHKVQSVARVKESVIVTYTEQNSIPMLRVTSMQSSGPALTTLRGTIKKKPHSKIHLANLEVPTTNDSTLATIPAQDLAFPEKHTESQPVKDNNKKLSTSNCSSTGFVSKSAQGMSVLYKPTISQSEGSTSNCSSTMLVTNSAQGLNSVPVSNNHTESQSDGNNATKVSPANSSATAVVSTSNGGLTASLSAGKQPEIHVERYTTKQLSPSNCLTAVVKNLAQEITGTEKQPESQPEISDCSTAAVTNLLQETTALAPTICSTYQLKKDSQSLSGFRCSKTVTEETASPVPDGFAAVLESPDSTTPSSLPTYQLTKDAKSLAGFKYSMPAILSSATNLKDTLSTLGNVSQSATKYSSHVLGSSSFLPPLTITVHEPGPGLAKTNLEQSNSSTATAESQTVRMEPALPMPFKTYLHYSNSSSQSAFQNIGCSVNIIVQRDLSDQTPVEENMPTENTLTGGLSNISSKNNTEESENSMKENVPTSPCSALKKVRTKISENSTSLLILSPSNTFNDHPTISLDKIEQNISSQVHSLVQIGRECTASPNSLKCGDCPFTTLYPGCLISHTVEAHGIQVFACSKCDFSATSAMSIMEHNFENHRSSVSAS